MIQALNNSLSALSALSLSQQVSANNVANLNTNGFQASRADFASGPQDQGVQVSISQPQSQAPLVPAIITYTDASGQSVQTNGNVQGSNTDLVREMVTQMTDQSAFAANVAVARSSDEMAGTLLNMIV